MSNSMQADLVAALSEISNPSLDGQANYGKYATLSACLKAANETLSSHNLSVIQMAHTDPDRLVTRIVHTSGEFIEDGGVPLLSENKANPQKMGSAITYARRYGLCSMLGIVGEEDDDGLAATPVAERPDVKTPAKKASDAYQKVEEMAEKVVPPTIVADDIPFSAKDTRKDWSGWVDEQILGMQKHRHLAEHKQWSSIVKDHREQCAREDAASTERLLAAYNSRKLELENRS